MLQKKKELIFTAAVANVHLHTRLRRQLPSSGFPIGILLGPDGYSMFFPKQRRRLRLGQESVSPPMMEPHNDEDVA